MRRLAVEPLRSSYLTDLSVTGEKNASQSEGKSFGIFRNDDEGVWSVSKARFFRRSSFSGEIVLFKFSEGFSDFGGMVVKQLLRWARVKKSNLIITLPTSNKLQKVSACIPEHITKATLLYRR